MAGAVSWLRGPFELRRSRAGPILVEMADVKAVEGFSSSSGVVPFAETACPEAEDDEGAGVVSDPICRRGTDRIDPAVAASDASSTQSPPSCPPLLSAGSVAVSPSVSTCSWNAGDCRTEDENDSGTPERLFGVKSDVGSPKAGGNMVTLEGLRFVCIALATTMPESLPSSSSLCSLYLLPASERTGLRRRLKWDEGRDRRAMESAVEMNDGLRATPELDPSPRSLVEPCCDRTETES